MNYYNKNCTEHLIRTQRYLARMMMLFCFVAIVAFIISVAITIHEPYSSFKTALCWLMWYNPIARGFFIVAFIFLICCNYLAYAISIPAITLGETNNNNNMLKYATVMQSIGAVFCIIMILTHPKIKTHYFCAFFGFLCMIISQLLYASLWHKKYRKNWVHIVSTILTSVSGLFLIAWYIIPDAVKKFLKWSPNTKLDQIIIEFINSDSYENVTKLKVKLNHLQSFDKNSFMHFYKYMNIKKITNHTAFVNYCEWIGLTLIVVNCCFQLYFPLNSWSKLYGLLLHLYY